MAQSDKDLEIENLKKDLEIQKLRNDLARSNASQSNASNSNVNNNQQTSTVVVTAGGGHGGQKQISYCGPISWLIGCFLFPCICCCPVDKKWV